MPTPDYGNFQVGKKAAAPPPVNNAQRQQQAQQAIAAQAAAKRQAAANSTGRPPGANYGGGNVAPSAPAREYHNAAAQRAASGGTPTNSISNELYAIMARSGSRDPSDPYNWRGIAAGLAAQAAPAPVSAPAGGGNFAPGGNNVGAGGSTVPAPPPPVVVPPTSYTAPPSVQPPTAVEANAGAGERSGTTFLSQGGGTFGMFDRLRNQRSPRSGLSVTPEMLRAAAAARLGSGT